MTGRGGRSPGRLISRGEGTRTVVATAHGDERSIFFFQRTERASHTERGRQITNNNPSVRTTCASGTPSCTMWRGLETARRNKSDRPPRRGNARTVSRGDQLPVRAGGRINNTRLVSFFVRVARRAAPSNTSTVADTTPQPRRCRAASAIPSGQLYRKIAPRADGRQ